MRHIALRACSKKCAKKAGSKVVCEKVRQERSTGSCGFAEETLYTLCFFVSLNY